jgi:hypothetical protein
MVWEQWNQWTIRDLPRINRDILAGSTPPEALIADFRTSVLDRMPTPESLSSVTARRVLVLLGLAGSSIARHYQEADLTRKAEPHRAFDELRVGPDGVPFLSYFARTAATTGTGHVGRDSYASLVRWNAPTTEVRLDGEVVARLPGAFLDLSIRTYTSEPGETAFFELLKKSEAFELAINELLEPMSDGSIDILAPEAAVRAVTAARLMTALIRYNQEFASRLPAEGGLRPEHFMDVFRQFAVHWRVGDLPPTGAQDPEFLRRDFLLGIDFPDYIGHTRRIFPALLPAERTMLTRQAARPPLPRTLLTAVGLDRTALTTASPPQSQALVREHPGLAAWYLLLAANAKFGAVHLMLTERFLFKPQRQRDLAGAGDRPLVSNRRGTTGMEESLLIALTRARQRHLLRALARVPHRDLVACAAGYGAGALDDPARLPTARFVASVG